MKKPQNPFDPFNQRGAVMVETALVLPIFLALLLCCLDLPRLVVVKQRLAGASRFAVEGEALELSLSSPAKLHLYFFDDMPTVRVRQPSIDHHDSSVNWLCSQPPIGWLQSLSAPDHNANSDGLVGKILHYLKVGAKEFAVFPRVLDYLFDPIRGDEFYGTRCKSDTSFLLAPLAYQLWVDYDGNTAYVPALHKTYIPNRKSFRYHPRSWVAKTGSAIRNLVVGPIKRLIKSILSFF
jgi:hypothetical protein